MRYKRLVLLQHKKKSEVLNFAMFEFKLEAGWGRMLSDQPPLDKYVLTSLGVGLLLQGLFFV